jgi:hypothetical protein
MRPALSRSATVSWHLDTLVHLSATDVSRRNAPQFSQPRCFPDNGFGAKSTAREARGDLRGS